MKIQFNDLDSWSPERLCLVRLSAPETSGSVLCVIVVGGAEVKSIGERRPDHCGDLAVEART